MIIPRKVTPAPQHPSRRDPMQAWLSASPTPRSEDQEDTFPEASTSCPEDIGKKGICGAGVSSSAMSQLAAVLRERGKPPVAYVVDSDQQYVGGLSSH
jgi:hypothetical protein